MRLQNARWNALCKALPFEIENETLGSDKKLVKVISSTLTGKQSIDGQVTSHG